MAAHVKRENVDISTTEVISVTSTSHGAAENSDFNFSDDDTSAGEEFGVEINPKKKKQRIEAVLPVGFLDPIRSDDGTGAQSCIYKAIQVKEERVESSNGVAVAAENGNESLAVNSSSTTLAVARNCRQFWKAGDYDVDCGRVAEQVSLADMDHVRVHPRFLHSNATSHKWALGAFAELLDNALDEVCNGATYVSIDVLKNKEHNNKMVVIQDNGGGMTPDKMRQCMSLGYSAKSRMANTIGQYGNGFKTSTMRLGADVIVFSRCQGKYGGRTTQSIGMLSYTFLQNTGKEDIVVPMIDFEKVGQTWKQHVKSSQACWQKNLEIIVQWSPFQNEDDLLQQFDFLEDQGTRIIIYNLWEDDLGSPELDFDTDEHDIQIRGASRDEKKIAMAKSYPSCRHFLTYRHSLKSYASILYRRIPPGFHITLRGEDVDHHDIVDDLIHTTELVYKPAAHADVALRDPNKQAEVTIGFVKDATHHIDVQGFNVYHKNRLIKPFWRVWNAAGSDGRGVIGVLEANFVEPAHDKQGFERTIALSRLEARLINLQKNYWSSNCHLIGYAQRRHSKKFTSSDHDASSGAKDKSSCKRNTKTDICNVASLEEPTGTPPQKSTDANEHATPLSAFNAILLTNQIPKKARNQRVSSSLQAAAAAHVKIEEVKGDEPVMAHSANDVVEYGSITSNLVLKLKQENESLRNSLKNVMLEFQFEKDRNKSLQNEVDETNQKLEKLDREQEVFVGSFAEERNRRDEEELKMRKKLQEASATIKGLLDKLEILAATK